MCTTKINSYSHQVYNVDIWFEISITAESLSRLVMLFLLLFERNMGHKYSTETRYFFYMLEKKKIQKRRHFSFLLFFDSASFLSRFFPSVKFSPLQSESSQNPLLLWFSSPLFFSLMKLFFLPAPFSSFCSVPNFPWRMSLPDSGLILPLLISLPTWKSLCYLRYSYHCGLRNCWIRQLPSPFLLCCLNFLYPSLAVMEWEALRTQTRSDEG